MTKVGAVLNFIKVYTMSYLSLGTHFFLIKKWSNSDLLGRLLAFLYGVYIIFLLSHFTFDSALITLVERITWKV